MKIALSGSTGLLGRTFLLEAIKRAIQTSTALEVFVLGRDVTPSSLKNRLINILESTALAYFNQDAIDLSTIHSVLQRIIIPVPFDLSSNEPASNADILTFMRRTHFDAFIHMAALTDLRATSLTRDAVFDINWHGTQRLLALIDSLQVKHLAYIGTAYSCGQASGTIQPNTGDLSNHFRNPYEESKLRAEIAWQTFAEARGLPYCIYRPSVLSGQLLEKPLGFTSAFAAFYAWARFFLKYKQGVGNYDKTVPFALVNMPVRIHINLNAGLNIIPVDYAAKLLYEGIFRANLRGHHHLVSNSQTHHATYIPWILDALGISGYSFTPYEPIDKNDLERTYYKSAGRILGPYITCDSMHFDRSSIDDLDQHAACWCPRIDRDNFRMLMEYARRHHFGLTVDTKV